MKNSTDQYSNQLSIPVIRGKVLGVLVYRGYAKLCDLSRVSKPDVYDQFKNPTGTQRDLNPSHAKAAYEYIKTKELAFWPEVFLCVREKDIITYVPTNDETPDIGILYIDQWKAEEAGRIAISIIDGNHRLYYANGLHDKYPPIEKVVSFCLATDLSREEEIQLFKDINDNQRAMNTSHLDNIEARLTPEEMLKKRNPDLYIAQKLGRDNISPLFERVYEGGKKVIGADIPLRGLRTGIEYMLSRSTQLPRLDDAEAQYLVIRNYFLAVKQWQPTAWQRPKEYIILSGAGLWAICFIGAHVIDRSLIQDMFDTEIMLKILKSGKEWDWSRKGDFKGLSGRAGALEVSRKVTQKLHDGTRMSSQDLFEKIMKEKEKR
jgi:DGQHR domain-containing protein